MIDNPNSIPKVLIVDLSMNYGGASSRVLSLMSNSFPGKIALAGLKSGAVTQQAQRLGLPVHFLGHHKADPRILINFTNIIRENGYQILDAQNIQSKFWASIAAKLTNTTLVSTINSWYANEHGQSSMKGKIYTALELMTNWGLDLYITVSEKDRQALLQSKIPDDAIELIYNAVEIDPAKISGDSKWLSEKFNLPPQSIICTAVGRLVPVKGYDVLIDAVQRISTQAPRLICLIVGEGESQEELIRQIQRTGMEDRIRLAGFQNRETVLSILKSSDIFVMPSRYEGTPIALLEAAAMGRPILASATGGIPELVTNDMHAILVPPGDSTALAEGLLSLSADRNRARALGQNAQERVQKEFSIAAQVRNTWNAYQKAWNRHNKPA